MFDLRFPLPLLGVTDICPARTSCVEHLHQRSPPSNSPVSMFQLPFSKARSLCPADAPWMRYAANFVNPHSVAYRKVDNQGFGSADDGR